MAERRTGLGLQLPEKRWWRAVGLSSLIVLLVALGSTEQIGVLTAIVLAAVFSAAGAFLWMFPGSLFFVLAFANSLAIYTSIYFFLIDANFGNVDAWAAAIGYLLPIYLFLAGVLVRKESIRRVSRLHDFRRTQFQGRLLLWLVPMGVLSALTFLVPGAHLEATGTDVVLLAAMGLVGVFVMIVSRQICLFLIDTGTLFDQLFVQMAGLFRPAYAFFTLYSFIVIVFAMIYRIMDRITEAPIFLIEGIPTPISFTESLYFSLITMSTVGYGDITPASESVRVVAAIEILLGILLFLFGFAEIMRHARGRDRRPEELSDRDQAETLQAGDDED